MRVFKLVNLDDIPEILLFDDEFIDRLYEQANKEEVEMSKLKNCPQCGHKTTRDFCTPQCRMEDSDNRIEAVEAERDKYKKALEEIASQPTLRNAFTMKHDNLVDIAKEALEDE